MSQIGEENNKFINAGVVFNKIGEVLLVRRAEEERYGNGSALLWAFPGGTQKYGESREECVKRNLLERTGYDVKYIRQLSLRVHPQYKVLIAYHHCELISPDPVLQNPIEAKKVAEIRWVKPEEVEKMITSDLDETVKKFLRIQSRTKS